MFSSVCVPEMLTDREWVIEIVPESSSFILKIQLDSPGKYALAYHVSKGAGLDGPLQPHKFCDSIDTFKSAFCNIQKTPLGLVEVPLWKLYQGLQLGKPVLPEVDISVLFFFFFFPHFKQF